MDRNELDAAIDDAPPDPGVYIFREDERPLYVGKAVDIRERLRSYRDPRTPRIAQMVDRADAIETRTTEDGRQALLLEANLIKRYQPKYNTRLKDGKSYPVIELTDHRFPQIRASRDPDERSLVFGPFTSMARVETAIRAFRDLYGLRACSDHTLETRDRPCVAYQMGLCSAPCAGLISEEEYADRVETIRSFFREDRGPVMQEIKDRMHAAADEQRFERAATLKSYRDALRGLTEGVRERDTGTVHALAVSPDRSRVGQVVIEDDQIREKTTHRMAGESRDQAGALAAFIQQFYARSRLPDRIIVPVEVDDGELVDWLSAEGTEISTPEGGRDRVLVDAASSAATTAVTERVDRLAEDLGVDVDRIECFDVSHTGGGDVVGSDVVFVDGRPETDDYRRKLLTEENDDYHNMYELVRWRALRGKEGRDDRPDPDLLLIDGGPGQLKAARKALDEVGWQVPILGIVKPDDDIISLARDPEVSEQGRQVLVHARDEAHRFAHRTHTGRRDSVDPVLEQVDGVGPALRERLLREHGLTELRGMSEEELQEIDGVGPALAERIHAFLADD